MQYTLWSKDRLLGETDLGFIYRENGFRCGWLHPTAVGERLMPAATGVPPAMRAEFSIGPDATLHADILAAVDAEEALALEIRGPDGKRIETEEVWVVDTHYLMSLADADRFDDDDEMNKLTPEQEAEIEEWVAEWREAHAGEEWREDDDEGVDLPRYQLQLRLVDPDAIP